MEKLDRQDLIDLVTRLLNPQEGDTDEMTQQWMQQIKDSVEDPNVSDYIFFDDTGMTPAEIVDKALNYRPIEL